ncbi:hypothetical protein Z052_00905 [Halorubrum sp. C191]|nr:hypothetical protein Z052_00905 [Halorubrum sp. C191]
MKSCEGPWIVNIFNSLFLLALPARFTPCHMVFTRELPLTDSLKKSFFILFWRPVKFLSGLFNITTPDKSLFIVSRH